MEVTMLVCTLVMTATSLVAVLPLLGVDLRIRGRSAQSAEVSGFPPGRKRLARVWIALALCILSACMSAFAAYYFFRPRIVEKVIEKPVEKIIEKLVPQECAKGQPVGLIPKQTDSHPPRAAIIGGKNTKMDHTTISGFPAGIDLSHTEQADLKDTKVSRTDTPAVGNVTQGSGSALSVNQQGGITAGTVNVDTPPLKLNWVTAPSAPTEKFAYAQRVTVTPNVAFNPVSFDIICDAEIKEVDPHGQMIRPDFGITAQNNRIGYVYYENPPLPPGAGLTVGVYSTNPFSIVDVKPAVIAPRRNTADGP